MCDILIKQGDKIYHKWLHIMYLRHEETLAVFWRVENSTCLVFECTMNYVLYLIVFSSECSLIHNLQV